MNTFWPRLFQIKFRDLSVASFMLQCFIQGFIVSRQRNFNKLVIFSFKTDKILRWLLNIFAEIYFCIDTLIQIKCRHLGNIKIDIDMKQSNFFYKIIPILCLIVICIYYRYYCIKIPAKPLSFYHFLNDVHI